MVVLIREISSNGRKKMCSARCHNAKLPSCACICGSRYHGGTRAGDLPARVDKFSEEILREAKERGSKLTMQLSLSKGG